MDTQSHAPIDIRCFAGYALLGEAGRGGTGVVYYARHLRLNRRAAVKILDPSRLAHPDAHRRFIHEAQAMARLDHPNVATVFEAGECESQPFIASRWVDGANLAVRLAEACRQSAAGGRKTGGPFEVRQAVHMMRQITAGIRHAHEHGVLHCDLKPEPITGLRWSPDARRLAVARSKSLALLHPDSKEPPASIPFANATRIEFSPDSTRLALAAAAGDVHVHDCRTAAEIARLTATTPLALRHSPDGHWLAVVDRDAHLGLWDTRTWTATNPPIPIVSQTAQVAFSPDSRTLLTGSNLGEIELWDVVTRQQQAKLAHLRSSLQSAEFSPDGQWVLLATARNEARLLHVPDGLDAMRPFALPRLLNARFSSSGRCLLLEATDSLARVNSPLASKTPSSDWLALTQFLLGRTLRPDGSWSAMTPEQFRQLQAAVTARWSRLGPGPQATVTR